jgi:hypothetical protein
MAADKPYGGVFYFFSVSPVYFGYTVVLRFSKILEYRAFSAGKQLQVQKGAILECLPTQM